MSKMAHELAHRHRRGQRLLLQLRRHDFSFEPAAQYAGAGLGALGGQSAWANSRASFSARRPAFAWRRIPQGSSSTSKRQSKSIFGSRLSGVSKRSGCPGWSIRSSATEAAARAATDPRRSDAGFRAPRLLLLAQSFSAFAPGAQASGGYAAQKFELSGIYDLNRDWSLQIGAIAAPTGVNAPDEKGVLAALWRRF